MSHNILFAFEFADHIYYLKKNPLKKDHYYIDSTTLLSKNGKSFFAKNGDEISNFQELENLVL